ncbi:hypothetical protein [Flavobacterium sp. 7A]|uniref:hypothetical protein n=1 Tax=Flavobacterium sp. 7A TaxID=2940571 RepID=UPI002226C0F0|nr:hypothetical protein [Flavobacterium sp. 7A]MCW2120879.1 hypothetical protein [Flavobacterium sp. 7A]
MRICILILFLVSFSSFAQTQTKFEEYLYGNNGIELIIKTAGKTIIVSTFNSRPTINKDIAEKVLQYFRDKNPENEEKTTIFANEAAVNGILKVIKRGSLISLEFVVQTVEWKNGLIEVYKGPSIIK